MILSVMFSGVIIAHVAVIASLLRKTLLATASFQLIFGCVFIHTYKNYFSLFITKYEYQRIQPITINVLSKHILINQILPMKFFIFSAKKVL